MYNQRVAGTVAQWKGIYDDHHRLMVAMSFNSDVGDSWEFADDPNYPDKYSEPGDPNWRKLRDVFSNALDSRIAVSAFCCALAALALLAPIRENPRALAAFLERGGRAGRVWNAALAMGARRAGRGTLRLEVTLRKQHYLQACAAGGGAAVLGLVLAAGVCVPLQFIVAQLVFAYAFTDMLLAWSRRDEYTAGLRAVSGGSLLSINLFLWFKPDWI